ncbi:hypothetical protein ANCCAN_17899 [Ancylostoma caninum]|uniref:Bestrophin homolog n=1 Tax=Ancylostoma caninum TaxID=29170 RepID=A0A368FVN7_ANCCA|nr:hypothetical protein ANCCAN_17899 [Ancylostoma caninum]
MLNPFGEDDDDFECNALIDRNITMVLMMVDQGYDRPPDLKRDPFWDEEVEPLYSEESARIPHHPLKGSVSEVRLPDHVQEIRMVPHFDDRDPLISHSPSLRRRVSVVPVTHHEHRQNRPSIGSLEMFRSFKNKVGRSLSRGQIFDEEQPRKTVSHGHLPTLESRMGVKTEEITPNGDKSFSNAAFMDSQDDVNQSLEATKAKEVMKSSSTANLKSPHDFQHHVLDDVLEENEEEIGMKAIRKKSSIDPTGAEEESTNRNVVETEEEGNTAVTTSGTERDEPTNERKSSDFFIGQDSHK